jgi:hypothetical protein
MALTIAAMEVTVIQSGPVRARVFEKSVSVVSSPVLSTLAP